MRVGSRSLAGVGLTTILLATTAVAVDQPLAGKSLVLMRSASRPLLKLVIDDPAILVPAPGSADDPSVGGFEVLLFGHSTGDSQGFTAPAGTGWAVRAATPLRYTYRNPAATAGPSPVRAMRLRQGKGLKLVALETGLTLTGAQGSVGVLVRMGDTQLCALFDPPSVRRDAVGIFIARNADAPGLSSCTADGLFGLGCAESSTCGGSCPSAGDFCASDPGGGCACVPSCGGTAPACNGACAPGQECADIGGAPNSGCACLPAGSTGCGTAHTCSQGACPAGQGCYDTTPTTGCGCSAQPPAAPCGGPCPRGTVCSGSECLQVNCAPGFPCEPGATCSFFVHFFLCFPIPCTGGGGYPMCNGTCAPGLTCHGYVQGNGACYCAP